MRVKYPTHGRLPSPVKPFASINVIQDDITKEISINAQILLNRLVDDEGKEIEGAAFGLALDGSASMTDLYGTSVGPFGGTPNKIAPVAKGMLEFLSGYAGDGSVDFVFWAVGPGGKEIEEVGKIFSNKVDALKDDDLKPKKNMGRSTHLLPVIQYFTENKLKNAAWAMAVIITDGLIDDMEAVEKFTEQMAVEIHNGKRKLIKLVLIGFGEHVDVNQLERLDDFEASVDVDIWSSKLASEMEALHEVFDEVMSENLVIAKSGRIVDNSGKLLKAYNDGLPAKLEFKLESTSKGFKLEIPGQPSIEQDLTEALNLLKPR